MPCENFNSCVVILGAVIAVTQCCKTGDGMGPPVPPGKKIVKAVLLAVTGIAGFYFSEYLISGNPSFANTHGLVGLWVSYLLGGLVDRNLKL